MIIVSCRRHPAYKAQRAPKSCRTCAYIYSMVQHLKAQSLDWHLRYAQRATIKQY